MKNSRVLLSMTLLICILSANLGRSEYRWDVPDNLYYHVLDLHGEINATGFWIGPSKGLVDIGTTGRKMHMLTNWGGGNDLYIANDGNEKTSYYINKTYRWGRWKIYDVRRAHIPTDYSKDEAYCYYEVINVSGKGIFSGFPNSRQLILKANPNYHYNFR